MSKNWKKQTFEQSEPKEVAEIENQAPQREWESLEQFWLVCIKNQSPLIFEAFKSHVKAMGWDKKPEKYLECAVHFGIIEK